MQETSSAPLSRRAFIGTAAALPTAAWLAGCGDSTPTDEAPYAGELVATAPSPNGRLDGWGDVRALFDLDPDVHHLSAYILAPHSQPVRDAIETHRRALDHDPQQHYRDTLLLEDEVRAAAAAHLGSDPELIALTDSTTMGLGVLIGGMKFEPGDEILMTEHDHFAANEVARHAAERTGARVRKVALYPPQAPEQATVSGILRAIREGIGPSTRLVLVTWVHSSSGVRLPLREIAELVADANAGRSDDDRALLVVDGVHGFGGGPTPVQELGCDGFVAGAHKWLLGPRGTGVAWARPELWDRLTPIIPTFDRGLYGAWIDGETGTAPPGAAFTPGGYHSFEHRWALKEAFELHARIGAPRIAGRIDQLSGQLRDGLSGVRGVRVHAPAEDALRSGVVTFTVEGLDPDDVVTRLLDEHRVSATVTPYAVPLARLGTCWLNTEQEVDAAIRAVAAL
jgi:selenocysteine lyase/cysteine desulfurase